MTTDDGFDLMYTSSPVCPWCGYKDPEPCEIFTHPYHGDGSMAEHDCESCGKSYFVELSVEITYSSFKSER